MFGKRKNEPTSATHQFPDSLLAEAHAHPSGWVYEIRPGVNPLGAVPPEDIRGAWSIDAAGEPTGEFTPNPKYRHE